LDRSNLFTWLKKAIDRAESQKPPLPIAKTEIIRRKEELRLEKKAATFKGNAKERALRLKREQEEAEAQEEEEEDERFAAEPTLYTFELRHLGDRSVAPVEQFHYDPLKDTIEALTEEIAERAEDDAAGVGELCKYALVTDIARGRHAFWINPPDMEGESSSVDAPNGRGLVQQSIRHSEVLLHSHVSSTAARERAYMKENEALRKRCTQYEDRHMKMIEQQEEFMSRRMERDLTLRREVRSEERFDKVAESLMMGVPAVMNRFLGSKALPEASTPRNEMVKNLMGSVTDVQFNKLREIFETPQLMTFMELYQSFEKEEAAKNMATEAKKLEISKVTVVPTTDSSVSGNGVGNGVTNNPATVASSAAPHEGNATS
jgi:hypothetical protein